MFKSNYGEIKFIGSGYKENETPDITEELEPEPELRIEKPNILIKQEPVKDIKMDLPKQEKDIKQVLIRKQKPERKPVKNLRDKIIRDILRKRRNKR